MKTDEAARRKGTPNSRPTRKLSDASCAPCVNAWAYYDRVCRRPSPDLRKLETSLPSTLAPLVGELLCEHGKLRSLECMLLSHGVFGAVDAVEKEALEERKTDLALALD